jgi:hypothetical protein
MNQICMSCKFFKIEDVFSGCCKEPSKKSGDDKNTLRYVKKDDSCEQWHDCGQQYYIRLGWIKAQQKQANDMLHQEYNS